MILQCPNCGSVRVHARHDARKACGAAGTVVGMAGGAATGVSRAQTGIALGATLECLRCRHRFPAPSELPSAD